MEKRYILRKVGNCQGCQFEFQDRDEQPCSGCERNQYLIESLADKFTKREIKLPPPPVEDDTDVLEGNRRVLEDWGARPVKKKPKGLK